MMQASKRADSPKPIIKRPKPLPFPLNLYQTSVGKKWVMAITGVMIMGFVFVHMIGNLKLYYGVEPINHYAEWLRDLGQPALARTQLLWLMRVGIVGAIILHVHSAYSLTVINAKARPKGMSYQSKRDYIAADFAGRTMRFSGIIIFLFIIWHLADLTWGWVNPDYVLGDPYHNVTQSLSAIPVAALYIVANLALGIHLYHGAWSLFQSLGVNSPVINPIRRPFAVIFAAIVVIGNISFPLAVQFGIISEDNRTTPLANEVQVESETATANITDVAPSNAVITISEAAQ